MDDEDNISSQTKQNTRNKSVLKKSQKQSEEDLSYDGNNKPFYLLILVFTWILKFVLLLLEHDAASLKKSKFPETMNDEDNINSQTKQMTRNKSVYKRSQQKQSEQDLTSDGKSWFIILVLKTWIWKFIVVLL